MKEYRFTPRGVCSRAIDIMLEGDIIREVRFTGGCAGNTQGVASLVRDLPAKEAIARLSGIRCGFKSTSCPDQLAQAISLCMAEEAE